jgi:hypothetical protein
VQAVAELLQSGRTPTTPHPVQVVVIGPKGTVVRLLAEMYRCSLLCALLVAITRVKPPAVAVTRKHFPAATGCASTSRGAKADARIALSATAENSDLLMAIFPLLTGQENKDRYRPCSLCGIQVDFMDISPSVSL